MAKAGMKRPEIDGTEKIKKNKIVVPEIQGKAKTGNKKTKPIN